MVAAMPLQIDARPSTKTVSLRDLRRVAFGISAAILIVMIAGAINEDSGSVSASVLDEESTTKYAVPTVAITSVASDSYINEDEADNNGFTVVGSSTNTVGECTGSNCVVTTTVGGVARTATVAADGSFTVTYAAAAIAGVTDGTIAITAAVSNDDGAATQSNAFAILDTADPVVSQTTAVVTPNNDNTPNVIITSGEAGTLSYATCTFGSATTGTIAASSATTLTLDSNGAGGSLSDASYSSCKIRVTDTAGNIGSVPLSTFVIDTTVATPSETTAVTALANDATPDVVITTAEAGTIVVGGTTGCGVGDSAVASGANTVTLSASNGDGAYVCTITFTDALGNVAGSALTLTSFTLDTAVAVPSETTVVTTPTKDTTPDVVITTTQAGTIAVGGTTGCGVGDSAVA